MPPAPSIDQTAFGASARITAALLAAIGWAALALQLVLIVQTVTASGGTALGAIANFVSFFTILTNALVALTMSRIALGGTPSASWMGAVTVYIAVVGIIYALVLRALWSPTGWQKLADVALHDVTPLLAFGFWLAFVPKGRLRLADIPAWLAYPLAYLAYSLVRGAIVGWYPYPFLDAATFGYGRVALNAAGITAGFLTLSLGFVGLDRLITRIFRR